MRFHHAVLGVFAVWLFASPLTAGAKCATLGAKVMADDAAAVGLVFSWNPDTCEEHGFELPYKSFRDNKEIVLGWRDDGKDDLGYHNFNATDKGPVASGTHEYGIELYDLTGVVNIYDTTITIGDAQPTDAGADAAASKTGSTNTSQPGTGAQVTMCSTVPGRRSGVMDLVVELVDWLFFT